MGARALTYADTHERDAGTTKHSRECAKCHVWKHKSEFRKEARCDYGIRWECLACYNRKSKVEKGWQRRMTARSGVVQKLPHHPGSCPTLAMNRMRQLWAVPRQDQDLWRVGRRLL